jgi:hypothetical protein
MRQIIPLFNRFNTVYDAVPLGILTEVASAQYWGAGKETKDRSAEQVFFDFREGERQWVATT